MRFLIDEQLPPRLADRLREIGHEAEHVVTVLGPAASDQAVAAAANSRGAILLSKDEDFIDLAARDILKSPLVWLRTGNMTTALVWLVLEPQLPAMDDAVLAGERIVEIA